MGGGGRSEVLRSAGWSGGFLGLGVARRAVGDSRKGVWGRFQAAVGGLFSTGRVGFWVGCGFWGVCGAVGGAVWGSVAGGVGTNWSIGATGCGCLAWRGSAWSFLRSLRVWLKLRCVALMRRWMRSPWSS